MSPFFSHTHSFLHLHRFHWSTRYQHKPRGTHFSLTLLFSNFSFNFHFLVPPSPSKTDIMAEIKNLQDKVSSLTISRTRMYFLSQWGQYLCISLQQQPQVLLHRDTS